MKNLWILFCTIVVVAGLIYLMFYPVIFAFQNNAVECLFAEDTMTCVQVKKK